VKTHGTGGGRVAQVPAWGDTSPRRRTATTAIDLEVVRRRAAESLRSLPRPFLKWAGSKKVVAAQIVPHLPRIFGSYWEPFLGGGTLFFLLQPRQACLGDLCSPLIRTYKAVRDEPELVYSALSRLRVAESEYYRVRASAPRLEHTRAARFIYLNKACWNGLYRVNLQGDFNVPFGRPKGTTTGSGELLRACSEALAHPGVSLVDGDFETLVAGPRVGDVVFLDPPYATTGPRRSTFLEYNEKIFSWRDQVRLAEAANELAHRGCSVYVTNSSADEIADLYRDFESAVLIRQSTIASRSSSRGLAIEALYFVRNDEFVRNASERGHSDG
jgi:DNA adenine methylase